MPKKKMRKNTNHDDSVNINNRQVYNILYYPKYVDAIDYLMSKNNEDVVDSIHRTIVDLANHRLDSYQPHSVGHTHDGLAVYDVHPKPPNLNNNVSIFYTYDDVKRNLRIALRIVAVPVDHTKQGRDIGSLRTQTTPKEDQVYFETEPDVQVTMERFNENGESEKVAEMFQSLSKFAYSKTGTEHKIVIYPKEWYGNVRYFISVDDKELSVRFKTLDDAKKYVVDEVVEEVEVGVYGSTIVNIDADDVDFEDLRYVLNTVFYSYYRSKSIYNMFSFHNWSLRIDLHALRTYRFQLEYQNNDITSFGMDGNNVVFHHHTGMYGFDFLDCIEDIVSDTIGDFV